MKTRLVCAAAYIAYCLMAVWALEGTPQDTPATADFCQRNCQPGCP